ncbi:MAG: hypothetical protein GWN29_11520, partial [Gammaproteobacteria bacterium]|nr:hypothetical protein [Gammaproteobacteria bacterium]
MLSVPLDFGSDFSGTLEALLQDQAEFGTYDPVRWRAFRFLPATSNNVEITAGSEDDFRPQPGRAFWLISRQG